LQEEKYMDTTALIPLLVSSLATFFAMCNPIANTPIFIGMTAGDDAATKKAVARRAVIVAFAIAVVMAAFGKLIGELFGIALPAFKIGAGFLVFMIGYHMVSGESHGSQKASDSDIKNTLEQELNKAVSPLGIPILAGGGVISSAVVFSATNGFEGLIAVIVGFGIIMIVTYFFFLSGDAVEKKLGQSGINALTRVMGLILLTIGVQIFLGGVSGALNVYLPTVPGLLSGSGS
jgi:multiple antibiotic resistance protein